MSGRPRPDSPTLRLSDWIDSDSEELGEEAEDAAYALAAEITGY